MQNEPVKQTSAYESELKSIWMQMGSLEEKINQLPDKLQAITDNTTAPGLVKTEKPNGGISSPLVNSLVDIRTRLESFNTKLDDLTLRFTI